MIIDFAHKLTETYLSGLRATTDMVGPDDDSESGERCTEKIYSVVEKIDTVAAASDTVEATVVKKVGALPKKVPKDEVERSSSPVKKYIFAAPVPNKTDETPSLVEV